MWWSFHFPDIREPGYLRSLLFIEPWPRTNCFRQFLGIAMPPPPPAGFGLSETLGPAVLLGHRIPMGALAILLSFCKAADALGICSRVCQSFQAAALHSSAWPSLKLCSSTAERVVDSLSYILMSTCANLQDLSLDITFQQQGLSVAQPAELVLRRLRKLELKLGDPEGNTFAGDLLSCVESPKLKDFKLLAVLTPHLLDAVRMALLSAEGLHFLSLTALADPSEVILGAETVAAIQEPSSCRNCCFFYRKCTKGNVKDGTSAKLLSMRVFPRPPGFRKTSNHHSPMWHGTGDFGHCPSCFQLEDQLGRWDWRSHPFLLRPPTGRWYSAAVHGHAKPP